MGIKCPMESGALFGAEASVPATPSKIALGKKPRDLRAAGRNGAGRVAVHLRGENDHHRKASLMQSLPMKGETDILL